MPVTIYDDGTQSTTANTEHFLSANPETTPISLQVWLDLNALTAGTTCILRKYEKVLSGGTSRVFWYDIPTGVMGDVKIWVSPIWGLFHGWAVSIEVSASSLSIPWSLRDFG